MSIVNKYYIIYIDTYMVYLKRDTLYKTIFVIINLRSLKVHLS